MENIPYELNIVESLCIYDIRMIRVRIISVYSLEVSVVKLFINKINFFVNIIT